MSGLSEWMTDRQQPDRRLTVRRRADSLPLCRPFATSSITDYRTCWSLSHSSTKSEPTPDFVPSPSPSPSRYSLSLSPLPGSMIIFQGTTVTTGSLRFYILIISTALRPSLSFSPFVHPIFQFVSILFSRVRYLRVFFCFRQRGYDRNKVVSFRFLRIESKRKKGNIRGRQKSVLKDINLDPRARIKWITGFVREALSLFGIGAAVPGKYELLSKVNQSRVYLWLQIKYNSDGRNNVTTGRYT